MSNPEQYFECNEPSVIFERFDDETILINLDSGHYYSLDPVGVAVWELLAKPETIDQISDRLQAHFTADGTEVDSAIREFISLLQAEQLIRPRATTPASETTAAPEVVLPEGGAFTTPALAKYDDMAEMLLLDPVHDVDETGWPQAAPEAESAIQVEDEDASSWPSLDDET